MKLVKVLDLVGQNIKGKRADIRCREADGSLRYGDLSDQKKPIMVTMESAKIEKRKHCTPTAVDWLYWRYSGHSCGYSGQRLDAYLEQPTYIKISTAKEALPA